MTRRSLRRFARVAAATAAATAAAVALIIAYGPASAAMAQAQRGAVPSVSLASDAAGQLVITWEAPDSAPTDYRIAWANAELDWLSYQADNEDERGNEYPLAGVTTLTLDGLTPGDTYKVRMRSRYYNANRTVHQQSGPWTDVITQRVRTPPAEPESEETTKQGSETTTQGSELPVRSALRSDTIKPTFVEASVNGTSLVITFSEDLGAADDLANNAFPVKKGPSQRQTLTGAPVIAGSMVTLTLATAVTATDTEVVVAYIKPSNHRRGPCPTRWSTWPATNWTPSTAAA